MLPLFLLRAARATSLFFHFFEYFVEGYVAWFDCCFDVGIVFEVFATDVVGATYADAVGAVLVVLELDVGFSFVKAAGDVAGWAYHFDAVDDAEDVFVVGHSNSSAIS